MNLAPIGIITYSRIEHLKQTINSLKKNDLASESDLYIFLDAPKKGDEEKVAIVREYIYTVNGFKKVKIVERKINSIHLNGVLGIQELFKKYGKCIFMEDDNIVSSSFLEFMNDGLEFYKNDKKIFAINGFNIPLKFSKQNMHDYYLSGSFHGWGFAFWEDRGYLDIVNRNDQYDEMIADKELYKKVKKTAPFIIPGLKLIHEEKLNAGDYKIVFHLVKNNLYTIKPFKSFVHNIGNDGSGVHCGVTSRFDNNDLNNQKIKFVKNLTYNNYYDTIECKFHMENKIFTRELPFRIYRKIKSFLKLV